MTRRSPVGYLPVPYLIAATGCMLVGGPVATWIGVACFGVAVLSLLVSTR